MMWQHICRQNKQFNFLSLQNSLYSPWRVLGWVLRLKSPSPFLSFSLYISLWQIINSISLNFSCGKTRTFLGLGEQSYLQALSQDKNIFWSVLSQLSIPKWSRTLKSWTSPFLSPYEVYPSVCFIMFGLDYSWHKKFFHFINKHKWLCPQKVN